MIERIAWAAFALFIGVPSHGCEGRLGVSRTIGMAALPKSMSALLSDELSLMPGEVVLTFDDGPNPRVTPQILDLLEEYCTKATFFVLGRSVSRHPDIVRSTASSGHTIGSHTYLHRRPSMIDLDLFLRDIDAGAKVLRDVLGRETVSLFRPPFLHWPEEVAVAAAPMGLAVIGADVTGRDWDGQPCEKSAKLIRDALAEKGRGIILMHDIHENTVCELRLVLEHLDAQDFRIVHLMS